MSKIATMLAKARQKSDFDFVAQHFGCTPDEVEEMRVIANANRAEAREYFAWQANEIREGRA